jgi:hypothetical protein
MADLNFLNVTTACTDIKINTPTAGKTYLQYISGLITKNFSAIKSYQIKYSSNCCPNTELVLPVQYQLELGIDSCFSGSSIFLEMSISGINKNLIDPLSISYSIDGINYTSTILTSSTSPIVNVTVPIPGVTPTTYTIYIKFKNLDGFEYIISDEFTWSNPLDYCDIIEADTHVTVYPSLPANVVIDGSGNLDFDLLLGSTTGAVSSGVYQVIICEETLTSLSCIQNFYFVDCGLKCSVIAKLAECKDSDILFFYDALTYSNDCQDSVSYTEVCAMFELMNKKLSSPDCKSPWDDCNCNGTTKIYNQNNSSATTVRNCNC